MSPPAPARFSTTTCWPICSESVLATMRAVVSVPPPGSKPTTVVTGLAGYWAWAQPMPSASAARMILMVILLVGDDAGALDDRPPFCDFVLDELQRLFGRVLHDGRAARFQRVAGLRIAGRGVQRLVEARD